MKHTVFGGALLGALVILCGCSTTETAREPYVKPGCIMLTADQAEARGIKVQSSQAAAEAEAPLPKGLHPMDASAVITQPDIKVYSVGRLVDPSDRNMMHEAHVVYRRETTPKWRLQAPTDQQIMVGPRITDGRQAQKPLLDQELDAYLMEQRKAAAENRRAIETLYRGVDALSKQQQQILKMVAEGQNPPSNSKDQPEQAQDAAPAKKGSKS